MSPTFIDPLTDFIVFVGMWFLMSLISHEAGHFIAAKNKGYKPVINISWKGVKVVVPGVVKGSHDDLHILALGVLMGYIPTLLYLPLFKFWFVLFLFASWSIGSWSEWSMLWRLLK